MENAVGRSINLALSCRGIEALKRVGLDQAVRVECNLLISMNNCCYNYFT